MDDFVMPRSHWSKEVNIPITLLINMCKKNFMFPFHTKDSVLLTTNFPDSSCIQEPYVQFSLVDMSRYDVCHFHNGVFKK